MPITDTPPVEVLPEEMGVPVNISRDGLNGKRWKRRKMSPLIHWSPSSSNSLEDNPLAVPDAGEVTHAVETAAIRIPGTSHVQHPGKITNNEG